MGEACCCCCCQSQDSEHGIYEISLDKIHFVDERELKRGLEQNFGICAVRFDFFKGKLIVDYNPGHTTTAEIDKALNTPGYIIKTNLIQWVGKTSEKHGKRIRLIASTFLVIASWAMLFMFGGQYSFPQKITALTPIELLYILLNVFAIAIAGIPTLRGTLAAIRERKLNVSVLIAIASTGAVFLGDWLEAATVLFITVVGEAMEGAALVHSNKEVLVASVAGAKCALVKDEKGQTVEVPVYKVAKGQILEVRQGMKIPVDAKVIKGNGQVNEAAITGESRFLTKQPGGNVFAGSILESGFLEIEAVSNAANTALARIAELVEKARKERTHWETTVDKFARYFIPLILIVGVAVTAASFLIFKISLMEALERGITILVVACPCALVLATPTAISAAVGKAARLGIIFKNGNVMERLSKISALYVDKTGTLTYSRPKVVQIKSFGNITENNVLAATAMVEKNSSHPIANALCGFAKSKNISAEEADDFMEFEGGGACAKKGNRLFKVGAKWLIEDGRDFPEEVLQWIDESEKEGFSHVLVADDERVLGGFRISDEVREDARDVLSRLRSFAIKKIVMLTGDRSSVAKHVAGELGVDDYIAECMPDTKLKKINSEKAAGEMVAMVGDGINDAPALVAADIGIAMGAMGSDAAVAAADISLMNKNLKGLADAVALSKIAFATIRWNIVFAVLGNFIMVGIVSMGHLNMLVGALLHQASALIVILNSYSIFIRRLK